MPTPCNKQDELESDIVYLQLSEPNLKSLFQGGGVALVK